MDKFLLQSTSKPTLKDETKREGGPNYKWDHKIIVGHGDVLKTVKMYSTPVSFNMRQYGNIDGILF